MKRNSNFAFTLAEIMIVLTVIGVLTAILLPAAFHASPDENIMKFKKANSTLGAAIRELINSGEYYIPGDFGKMPDGSDVTSVTYFCETLSDILNTKSVNCQTTTKGSHMYAEDWKANGVINMEVEEYPDEQCMIAENNSAVAEIITSDDISWFLSDPSIPFSNQIYYNKWDRNKEHVFMQNTGEAEPSPEENYYYYNTKFPDLYPNGVKNGFYYVYKILCIDVDGIGKGEAPFGYGIRIDGKIFPGKRATEWINKSVQKSE